MTDMKSILVKCTKTCIENISSSFFALFNSYFTLADDRLTVLECFINKNSNKDIKDYAPQRGACLCREKFGANAILLSSEKKDVAFLIRAEHGRKESKDLTCVAAPVKYFGTILGYVALSSTNRHGINGSRAFIESLARNIEYELRLYLLKKKVSEVIQSFGIDYHKFVLNLTEREETVENFMLKGYSNEMIAEELCVSEATIKANIKSIYSKYNTKSRADTVTCILCKNILNKI